MAERNLEEYDETEEEEEEEAMNLNLRGRRRLSWSSSKSSRSYKYYKTKSNKSSKSSKSSKSYYWKKKHKEDDDEDDDYEDDDEAVVPSCQAGGDFPTSSEPEICAMVNFLPSRDESFQKQPIVGNLTYDDLAAEHALWIFDREDYFATSPIFDMDGTLNSQSSGIPGVHFLTPTNQPTACLDVNISSTDVIFFDITETILLTYPSDTEADWFGPLRSFAEFVGFPNVGNLTEEEVTLTAARLATAYEQNVEARVFLDECELFPRVEYATSDIFRLSNSSAFEDGTYGAAGGFYGALGPFPAGEYTLRIFVRDMGINFASSPSFYTFPSNGTLRMSQFDNEFRLIVT